MLCSDVGISFNTLYKHSFSQQAQEWTRNPEIEENKAALKIKSSQIES